MKFVGLRSRWLELIYANEWTLISIPVSFTGLANLKFHFESWDIFPVIVLVSVNTMTLQ